MGNKFFELLCDLTEKINPDFDRTNAEDVEIMTKCLILSLKDDEIRKEYLDMVVKNEQKERLQKMIQEKGQQIVEIEIRKLELEKDIVETKIEITKGFLN